MTEPESDHVETTVQRMAELHAAHLEGQSKLQRTVSRLTRTISNPRIPAAALAVLLIWMALNSLAPRLGWTAIDPPPFEYLQAVGTAVALFTTLLILAAQSSDEEAARHRSQLTLQLASLSEQKIAKVIQLLEEQRSDNPQLSSRPDPEADEMARPSDPGQVLDRIKDTHGEV